MSGLFNCVSLILFIQIIFVSAKLPDWVTQDMLDMVADDKAKCMAEHGTTEDLIDQVNDGKIPDDPKITCYMHCLFESLSLIDEDGVLESDMLLGILPEAIQAKAGDILEVCGNTAGSDNCNKVFNIANCVLNKNPELWFMV